MNTCESVLQLTVHENAANLHHHNSIIVLSIIVLIIIERIIIERIIKKPSSRPMPPAVSLQEVTSSQSVAHPHRPPPLPPRRQANVCVCVCVCVSVRSSSKRSLRLQSRVIHASLIAFRCFTCELERRRTRGPTRPATAHRCSDRARADSM